MGTDEAAGSVVSNISECPASSSSSGVVAVEGRAQSQLQDCCRGERQERCLAEELQTHSSTQCQEAQGNDTKTQPVCRHGKLKDFHEAFIDHCVL